MKFPDHLEKVIEVLKKLPSVGRKSAERFAFHLLDWNEGALKEFATAISDIPFKIHHCHECGCLMDKPHPHTCHFCSSPRRDKHLLCIIATPKDAYAIEETREYHGLYHVLGGLISPLEGRDPEALNLSSLHRRLENVKCREVIIALDSTLEGDATALYLQQKLSALPFTVSRLAFGLPIGSSLDYVDGGTLAMAIMGRKRDMN